MSQQLKFEACLKRAEAIVRSYRDQAPVGCDPVNTWAAIVVGAGTALASAAYGAYQQNSAANAANAAQKAAQKKFQKIDFNNVNKQAIAADESGYATADADWAKRFPTLAKMRDSEMGDMQSDVTTTAPQSGLKGLDTAGFDESGLGGSQTTQARNLGLPVTSIRDRGRSYFSTLLGQNPQRSFGLSGQDAAQIAMANTNSQNIMAGAINGSNINAYNASVAQSGQNNQLLLGTLSSLMSSYAQRPTASGSPSTGYFGTSYNGIQQPPYQPPPGY